MAAGPKQGDAPEDESDTAADRSGLKSRVGDGISALFSRAREQTERMRDAALERRRSSVFQHACAARERGNLEAAFWLLAEECELNADHPEAALAYWEVALELGRPRRAADAAIALVQRHAASGDVALATLCWNELVGAVPDALLPPTVLAAMLPELIRRAADEHGEDRAEAQQRVRTALRHAVDSRNERPSAGVALRIFEMAHEIYPEAADRAAELALESPSLHEAKRARLNEWIQSRPRVVATASAPETPVDPSPHLEPPSPASDAQARAFRLQVVEVTPLGVTEGALEIETRSGRRSRVAFSEIEAISTVEIRSSAGADAPGAAQAAAPSLVLVDLVLNLVHRREKPLRVLRMRSDRFDPKSLVEDTREDSALRSFLADLMARASAVPLPDPESALGLRLATFDTIEAYETHLLGHA